jgi:hypothetical protein
MRETRQSGSEGGARSIPRPYPYPPPATTEALHSRIDSALREGVPRVSLTRNIPDRHAVHRPANPKT